MGQGLAVGWPRAVWAAVAAGCCDTLLIVVGAAGVSGLLVGFPALRGVLLLGGAAFLGYLGVQSWWNTVGADRLQAGEVLSPGRIIRRTIAVSLLNPHAILDTVGVIGAAIAAQPSGSRTLFASGAVTATSDYDAVRETDTVLITLPTPLTRNREPDLSIVLGATRDLAVGAPSSRPAPVRPDASPAPALATREATPERGTRVGGGQPDVSRRPGQPNPRGARGGG